MQESTYQDLGQHEDTLWRSVANREMVTAFWKKFRRSPDRYRTLDVGCGAGAMVKFLEKETSSFGMDESLLALELAKARQLHKLFLGDLEHLPVKSHSFDLISAIDVIEHTQNDEQVISELFRILKKDGLLISIIPAFNFLWSQRDERLGHKKRYTVSEIKKLMRQAGFTLLKCSYINLFYFVPFAALIFWRRLFNRVARIKTDVPAFPELVNCVLLGLLRMETSLLLNIDFPIGVSTVCVVRK